jgi:hypothetical protein
VLQESELPGFGYQVVAILGSRRDQRLFGRE